jgi:hypothetical protein
VPALLISNSAVNSFRYPEIGAHVQPKMTEITSRLSIHKRFVNMNCTSCYETSAVHNTVALLLVAIAFVGVRIRSDYVHLLHISWVRSLGLIRFGTNSLVLMFLTPWEDNIRMDIKE